MESTSFPPPPPSGPPAGWYKYTGSPGMGLERWWNGTAWVIPEEPKQESAATTGIKFGLGFAFAWFILFPALLIVGFIGLAVLAAIL